MMRRASPLRWSLLAGAAAAALALTWASPQSQDRFVHEEHARLFPTCAGCHEPPTAEGEPAMPSPEACARCHDGSTQRRVDWQGPSRRGSNLDFRHATVLPAMEAAFETKVECDVCHVPPEGGRMEVRRAVSESCLACHAPGSDHVVDAPCQVCHVRLREATFSETELTRLPKPATHDAPDFLLTHGRSAQADLEPCRVCHARELCASCHVNAEREPTIQSLETDARVARLVAGRPGRYPRPASHTRDWWVVHSDVARGGTQACATCHAQESCRTCHVDGDLAPIRSLPSRGSIQAQGVSIERRPPDSHTPGFAVEHGLAAAELKACAVCHAEPQCVTCHLGAATVSSPAGPRAAFHPKSFLQSHPTEAYNRQSECASCHNTEIFCQRCHAAGGLGTQGRAGTGFHDDQPFWLVVHGKPARQNLESCASCHAQRDCLVCHSATGGRRINPHGPEFDARRLREKNPALCLRCHFRSILDR